MRHVYFLLHGMGIVRVGAWSYYEPDPAPGSRLPDRLSRSPDPRLIICPGFAPDLPRDPGLRIGLRIYYLFLFLTGARGYDKITVLMGLPWWEPSRGRAPGVETMLTVYELIERWDELIDEGSAPDDPSIGLRDSVDPGYVALMGWIDELLDNYGIGVDEGAVS